MTISPRPRRAKSEVVEERGARSLIGASMEVATSTITGVPNTCRSAWRLKLKVEAEAHPEDVIDEQSREKDNGSQERIELQHTKRRSSEAESNQVREEVMPREGDVEQRSTDRDWQQDKGGEGYAGMVDLCEVSLESQIRLKVTYA